MYARLSIMKIKKSRKSAVMNMMIIHCTLVCHCSMYTRDSQPIIDSYKPPFVSLRMLMCSITYARRRWLEKRPNLLCWNNWHQLQVQHNVKVQILRTFAVQRVPMTIARWNDVHILYILQSLLPSGQVDASISRHSAICHWSISDQAGCQFAYLYLCMRVCISSRSAVMNVLTIRTGQFPQKIISLHSVCFLSVVITIFHST